jgi:putative tryptophan/tyrosine transport system substrate-binding protein
MGISTAAVHHRRKKVLARLLASWQFPLWPLGFSLLLVGWLSFAAPPKDVRVMVLTERSASFYLQALRGFKQQFTPGATVAVQYVDGDPRELNAAIDAVRKSPPVLVVAFGTQAAVAAREHLRDVPILYCLVLNPAQHDLAGANVGGVRLEVDAFQQFTDMEKLIPQVKRIGVIYNEPSSGALVRSARASLPPGVQLIARDARDARQAAHLIEEMLGSVDAFWLLWDPVIANVSNFRLLVQLSLKNKVALVAPASPFVEAGALMSVAADYEKAGQRASEIAQLVLEGNRVGEFREAPPTRVITINATVARQLGVSIPPGLRAEVLAPGVSIGQAPEAPRR